MSVIPTTKPISRRELVGWCFGAALLLTPILLTGVVVWMAYPPAQVYDLGPTDNFVVGQPAGREVMTKDGQTVPLWVVHADDRWLIFLGRMKISPSWNCAYKWVPINNRFEDPCSGFKWALTGERLTYFDNPSPTWQAGLRDLDQYAATLKDGHLMVNLDKRMAGQFRAEPPPNVICRDFGEVTNCQLSTPTHQP
jgi:hypothetical protein